MVRFFTNANNIKKLLVGYWLVVPILFLSYLMLTTMLQNISMEELLLNIPSLALTCIVCFLLFFQLYGLLFLTRLMNNKQSFLGKYLLFNLIQQVLINNFIGVILCFLYYKNLDTYSEKKQLTKIEYLLMYGLIFFVSVLTLIVIWARFLIT